jgi:hypothetical protein
VLAEASRASLISRLLINVRRLENMHGKVGHLQLEPEDFEAFLDLHGTPGRRCRVHDSRNGFLRDGQDDSSYRRPDVEVIATNELSVRRQKG